eukprot:CAMPEP_0117647822 /NCGR_PEP_ID=MMETSP0804-20121206/53_1 /TAXON_ID=1074897 /ORGANISM="Tetraselmis astigmatica, Strain CCMP880" /LENGTH=75 /DNA_ID=CAMNT_0005453337 /DNA_START=96 /DNA_END=323 /DNA_ORIENTATION=+
MIPASYPTSQERQPSALTSGLSPATATTSETKAPAATNKGSLLNCLGRPSSFSAGVSSSLPLKKKHAGSHEDAKH